MFRTLFYTLITGAFLYASQVSAAPPPKESNLKGTVRKVDTEGKVFVLQTGTRYFSLPIDADTKFIEKTQTSTTKPATKNFDTMPPEWKDMDVELVLSKGTKMIKVLEVTCFRKK